MSAVRLRIAVAIAAARHARAAGDRAGCAFWHGEIARLYAARHCVGGAHH